MPATKQASSTGDPNSPNWRFYKPIHPNTGKECPHPKSGWKFPFGSEDNLPDKRTFVNLVKDGRIAWGDDEKKVPRLKRMLHEVETNVGKSVFVDYSDGEKQTSAMFGSSGVFLAPKHADFVSRFIMHAANKDSIVLDCFGGSGSTAHAVMKVNREDKGTRKYILVEVGNYFNTVLRPRVMKAAYSTQWRNGKPISRSSGISHVFKYMHLESYEDSLNNLEMARSDDHQKSLDLFNKSAKEEYLLSYMLDIETRDSASLLNVPQFKDPFNYKLKITRNNETKETTVDLVETFNYLIGLHVKHFDHIRGIRVVEGTNRDDERILVLWRNTEETDNEKLDAWFNKQGYNTRDQEYDVVYVNGDNNLENLRRADQTWKVRMIEPEFKKLMFDVKDI